MRGFVAGRAFDVWQQKRSLDDDYEVMTTLVRHAHELAALLG
jgi:hypothetical protein